MSSYPDMPARVVVTLLGPRNGIRGQAAMTERSARSLAAELIAAAEKIESGEVA